MAKRGANLRRLVNSLQRLNTALAVKQAQIVQLVDCKLAGVQGVRIRTGERQPSGRGPPRHAQPDDRDARPGAGVRRSARSGGEQPAAGCTRAAGGQRGAGGAREAVGPDRAAADPSVCGRCATGRPRPQPGGRRSRDRDAEPDEGVRRRQPPRQHARLLPGRRPARLPVVARVARSQHAHAVLAPGRQRPVPPAVHSVQLPPDRDVDQFLLAVRTRRRAVEPDAAEAAVPGTWVRARHAGRRARCAPRRRRTSSN